MLGVGFLAFDNVLPPKQLKPPAEIRHNMDDWREADEPACPACGADINRAAPECPDCGEQLISEAVAEALDERMAEALEAQAQTAPRWAVVLTGLALGIAIAPLAVYAVVLVVGDLPLLVLAAIGLAGWLLPAAALSRLPNPSAVLSRGLYLVVGGIAAIVVALGYNVLTPGSGVLTDQAGAAVAVLALTAIVALLLARRIAGRAARQARGEPGPLHERAGIEPEPDSGPESEPKDDDA